MITVLYRRIALYFLCIPLAKWGESQRVLGLFSLLVMHLVRFPWWFSGKESACQCRRHKRHRFDPWVGKSPWSRKWHPTPVFWPGESHGHRSLVGYSPLGHKELDMSEVTQHVIQCHHGHKQCTLSTVYSKWKSEMGFTFRIKRITRTSQEHSEVANLDL